MVQCLRVYDNLRENCEKKEIENEITMTFSCDKYDNIRRKAFNDINEVDDINF